MTERKFTPPTTFPAEYVTRDGDKAVIVGTMPNDAYPYLGYVMEEKTAFETSWNNRGRAYEGSEKDIFSSDLFDIVPEPQKQMHWANDYVQRPDASPRWLLPDVWRDSRADADKYADKDRIAVIRREWVEGQLPQYFAEKV